MSDVVKSFDTVDREILDYVLCRLGLLGCFRHAYFEYHARVRLRFTLLCAWSELDLGWGHSSWVPVEHGLYFDYLKCASSSDDDLFETAWFTNTYIRLVGQTPAPS